MVSSLVELDMITLILTRFEVYIHKITVILIYLYVESDEINLILIHL